MKQTTRELEARLVASSQRNDGLTAIIVASLWNRAKYRRIGELLNTYLAEQEVPCKAT